MLRASRYETSSGTATAVALELLDVVRTGPESLRWSAVAPALLAALLRGDCLHELQCARCTTAVANHCASLLNEDSAARNSWTDPAVVCAVLGAATSMLTADAEAPMDEVGSTVVPQRPRLPLPSMPEKVYCDDIDRAYEEAIAAVTHPVSRVGLRGAGDDEANDVLDEMAISVLSLLRTLHTTGLDCKILSQYTVATLTAAGKSAARVWSATAESLVGAISLAPDPYSGWTLEVAELSAAPSQAALLAQVIAADNQPQGVQKSVSRTQASDTSMAAVADALLEQGSFDLLSVGELCGLPTDVSGLCAIAAALDMKSGVGAGRKARLATLYALCAETVVGTMTSTVPEYGQTIVDLAMHLQPLSREYEVDALLWEVLTATETAVAAAIAESRQESMGTLRTNLRAVAQYCMMSYQNCDWEQQTALRNLYYSSSPQVEGTAATREKYRHHLFIDSARVLLFGAPGMDAAETASLQEKTETALVAVFNKLINVSSSDDGQSAAVWSQIGRLALVSPTLLLRKVIATVAQQAGTETSETMVHLVQRLGPAYCHCGSSKQPLLTCCVSSQLKSSAQTPREVVNVVGFVRRLAGQHVATEPSSSYGSTMGSRLSTYTLPVCFSQLVHIFVLPHLATNSEHLPAALQLLGVALQHAAADFSTYLICQLAPDALGSALCSLLATGGRESLPVAVLETTVQNFELLLRAMKAASEEMTTSSAAVQLRTENREEQQQTLIKACTRLDRYAAQLHWTVALMLHDVCGNLRFSCTDTDSSDCSVMLAWAQGRPPMLCGQLQRRQQQNEEHQKQNDKEEKEHVAHAPVELPSCLALRTWDQQAGADPGTNLLFAAGDRILIVSEEPGQGWLTGRMVGDSSERAGIFPANFVATAAETVGSSARRARAPDLKQPQDTVQPQHLDPKQQGSNAKAPAPTTDPEDKTTVVVVVQMLSDLLFSCALADAPLQPSIELLTRLSEQRGVDRLSQGDDAYHPASILVAWVAEHPLEVSHMIVACVARLLPRLAQAEAKRLLCIALPRLFDASLLPQPPPSILLPQDTRGSETGPGSTSGGNRGETGHSSVEQTTCVVALHVGALAAVLWLQTAYPAAFSAATDINSTESAGNFLSVWPYSSSLARSLPGAASVDGSANGDIDDLRRLSLEAMRHSIACVQHVCADTVSEGQDTVACVNSGTTSTNTSVNCSDAAADYLGKFHLACGLVSCSAHAASTVSGSDAAGIATCAKTAQILALNLVQSYRELNSAQTDRADNATPSTAMLKQLHNLWARAVSEIPTPYRAQLQKLVKSTFEPARSKGAAGQNCV